VSPPEFNDWTEVGASIIEGLKHPVGTAMHDVAFQRLKRMAWICNYHLCLEDAGATCAESSLMPGRIEHFKCAGGVAKPQRVG
jgi:hypothetical protein